MRSQILLILARFVGRIPEELREDDSLSDLLEGAAESPQDILTEMPEAISLRPCELRLFLLAMTVEDELGIDLTTHARFDRLLCGTVGDLIAAAESL